MTLLSWSHLITYRGVDNSLEPEKDLEHEQSFSSIRECKTVWVCLSHYFSMELMSVI